MSSALVPRSDVPTSVARSELEATRRRVQASLATLERELTLGARLNSAFKHHPALTLGGALLLGWAAARLLPRRRRKD
jgi:hypothetical protein